MKIIHIFAINTHLEQQSIKYCHQYLYSPKIMIEGQKEQQYWKKSSTSSIDLKILSVKGCRRKI